MNVARYQGRYLFLGETAGFSATRGDQAELVSPTLPSSPRPPGGECLRFWFFMLTATQDVGSLQVVLREGTSRALTPWGPPWFVRVPAPVLRLTNSTSVQSGGEDCGELHLLFCRSAHIGKSC